MKQQELTPGEWARLAQLLYLAEACMREAWGILQPRSTKRDRALLACLRATSLVSRVRLVALDNRWLRENPTGDSPMLGNENARTWASRMLETGGKP